MLKILLVLSVLSTDLLICSGLPTKTEDKSSAKTVPKITYSKETKTYPGETVTLDCAVEGVDLSEIEDFEVRWSKLEKKGEGEEENTIKISANEKKLLFTDDIEIVHPEDTWQYSLKMKEVSEEDSGIYRCSVDFGEGQVIDANVPLVVQVAAYFSDSDVKRVRVAEGDAITIDCQPGGFPEPRVRWERVGANFPYTGEKFAKTNLFDLPLIHRTHQGHYRCLANNDIGEPVSSEIILEVDYKPDVETEATIIDASIYDEAVLTCTAEANPKAEFVWMKDEEPVHNSLNHRTETEFLEDNVITSKLTISQLQAEDFGKYSCVAVNSIGTTDAEMDVNMKTPPIIVKQTWKEKVFEIDSSPKGRDALPIALECEAKGSPAPTYRWTKDGDAFNWEADPRISVEYGTGTLLIRSPVMSDNGVYQCFAYNELGMAAADPVTLTNNTMVEFVREEPGNVEYEAELGRPFRLACPKTTGYPQPELIWMKARDVPEGVEMEYITSPRAVMDEEGTLWITHITEEDDTEKNNFQYVCLASSEVHPQDISLAKTIKLRTIHPEDGEHNINNDLINVESFAMHTSPEEVSFKTGEENSLWCIYGGEPVPTVTWSRIDGKELDTTRFYIKNNGMTLVFKDTAIEDKGEYQCVADNRVGTPKIYKMNVDIEVVPKFKEELMKQAQVVHEGTSVTFACAIFAEDIDPPKYEWFFNSRPIQVVDGSRRKIEGSNLVLKSVTATDTGNYACKASNSAGYAYGQTTLNVVPKAPGGTRTTALNDIKVLREDIESLRAEVQKLTKLVEQQLTSNEKQQNMANLLEKIASAVISSDPEIDTEAPSEMPDEPNSKPTPTKVEQTET